MAVFDLLCGVSKILLLALLIQQCSTQGIRKRNACKDHTSCGSCIGSSAECGWCMQEVIESHTVRCDLVQNLKAAECASNNIVRPENRIDYTQHRPLRDPTEDAVAVQISPQVARLTLTPNNPTTLRIGSRLAQNYPVDLYYIMDFSYSMSDDIAKLIEMSTEFLREMREITNNFRIGFGAFVDKKTLPYASITPVRLFEPCPGCIPTFGFKNYLSLTSDLDQFREGIMRAKISGNIDAPEGGFDAVMQAMVCQEIGWRDEARKLLVYTSDNSFHAAGDGLLGGIVKPNDGMCHLDMFGSYTESLHQDYPSITQIANKALEKNMNVLFLVTEPEIKLYQKLSHYIDGSVVGELSSDSSNIISLIRDNYKKISTTIELRTNASDNMMVSINAHCHGGVKHKSNRCDNVTIGQNVSFDVTVEVAQCPKQKERWQETVELHAVGLSESTLLHLDVICQCDCEQAAFVVEGSNKCTSNGAYACGVCTCDPGWFGSQCECDASSLTSAENQCLMHNSTEVCEGRGDCVCGMCNCHPIFPTTPSDRYSGAFCQCNDYACDYYNNELCGGPMRGVCKCGECLCNHGYRGHVCECSTNEEPCRARNGKICNDKGTCHCGRCICDQNSFYGGPTCSSCPTCHPQCELHINCVDCVAFGKERERCDAKCSYVETEDAIPENRNWGKCWYRDEEGCVVHFAYHHHAEIVLVQKAKDCPAVTELIVAAIILTTLLIGLSTALLWRVFFTMYDSR